MKEDINDYISKVKAGFEGMVGILEKQAETLGKTDPKKAAEFKKAVESVGLNDKLKAFRADMEKLNDIKKG